ncbi:MAG: hypothetical protein DCC75_05985 [Proteobacteria bacterium]|nr:MAG: hypothetical protein DCC75_05985 [Pseudomonadota bacterium]
MRFKLPAFALAMALGAAAALSPGAYALPFNSEMLGGQQLITGKIMRPKPAGSVARGSLERVIETRESMANAVNPVPSSELSVKRGRRLFEVNCIPCHGTYSDGKWEQSPLAQIQMPMPSIDLSAEGTRQRSDGFIFGYIYFGGVAIMPSYGWKLSHPEVWDIVNYVRKIQNTNR